MKTFDSSALLLASTLGSSSMARSTRSTGLKGSTASTILKGDILVVLLVALLYGNLTRRRSKSHALALDLIKALKSVSQGSISDLELAICLEMPSCSILELASYLLKKVI